MSTELKNQSEEVTQHKPSNTNINNNEKVSKQEIKNKRKNRMVLFVLIYYQ
jgi:hypothetical protein